MDAAALERELVIERALRLAQVRPDLEEMARLAIGKQVDGYRAANPDGDLVGEVGRFLEGARAENAAIFAPTNPGRSPDPTRQTTEERAAYLRQSGILNGAPLASQPGTAPDAAARAAELRKLKII